MSDLPQPSQRESRDADRSQGVSPLHHGHPELADAEYVVFVDSSRRYIDCSPGACQLLGYDRHELLQKSIDDVSYQGDEVDKLFQDYVQAGKQEGEHVLRRSDRTPVPIRYRAFVFSDGCHAAVWEPINDWRTLYLSALLEVNPAKLKAKIEIAVGAIQARNSKPDLTSLERQNIADATSALRTLLKHAK